MREHNYTRVVLQCLSEEQKIKKLLTPELFICLLCKKKKKTKVQCKYYIVFLM